MRILILENHKRAPAGLITEAVLDRGWELETLYPNSIGAELLAAVDLSRVDGVVALGGLQDAWDDEANPKFSDQMSFLRRCDSVDIPVLGVCLGAQLLARAYGADVHRMDNGPERGLVDMTVAKNSEAARVLFPDENCAPRLMSWHQDMFQLPQDSELILSSAACAHQGLFVGTCSYGLQCHVEATPEIVKGWIANTPDWHGYSDYAETIDFAAAMKTGRGVVDRWLDYVSTKPE